jgi:hypothetical protein
LQQFEILLIKTTAIIHAYWLGYCRKIQSSGSLFIQGPLVMKKAHASAIVVVSLALLTALPAEAGGRRYNNYGGNNGGMNGWAAAAIGAVVGVGLGAALAQQQPSANYYVQPAPVYQNNPNYYVQPAPVYQNNRNYYVQPAPVYQNNRNYYVQPAPVYQNNSNIYYVPQPVCQTAQVPVYNEFGQTVQYRQVCVN